MPSASGNPVAVRQFTAAPAKDGSRVKIGQYVFSKDKTGAIYVAESVFKESLAGIGKVAFKPILKPGVDPDKPRFAVADFKGDFGKPNTNMLFEVYTVPPDGDRPGRPGERFKFKPSDRSFQHGSVFGGPKVGPDGAVLARCDRACREILHWIMKRVEGFDDLLFEDPTLVARLSARAEPPVEAAEDKSFEELGLKPRQRPISADSKSTRQKLAATPVIANPLAGPKPDTRSETAPTHAFHISYSFSQTDVKVDVKAPNFPLEELIALTKTLQASLGYDALEARPTQEIMPTSRVVELIDQVLEGGLVNRDEVIRKATKPLQFPGSVAYVRCLKRLERIVESINDGRLADELGLPRFQYRLVPESYPAPVGAADGEPLQRQTVFYRKTALEADQEMQVLR